MKIEEGEHSSELSKAIVELLPDMNMKYYLMHRQDVELENAKKYLSCKMCGKCGCDCEVIEEEEDDRN